MISLQTGILAVSEMISVHTDKRMCAGINKKHRVSCFVTKNTVDEEQQWIKVRLEISLHEQTGWSCY